MKQTTPWPVFSAMRRSAMRKKRTGIVKLIECRLFSAFLHEAKLLNFT